MAAPQGLLCLTMTQAGASKSLTIARAASRSRMLLKEICLPWCCCTCESTCRRAPTCE